PRQPRRLRGRVRAPARSRRRLLPQGRPAHPGAQRGGRRLPPLSPRRVHPAAARRRAAALGPLAGIELSGAQLAATGAKMVVMHAVAALRRTAAAAVLLVGLLAWLSGAAGAQAQGVLVTEVDGAITPVVADHLADAVAEAEDRGHQALVVELDTPGGLESSMREIVQAFLGAEVPVIVYVAPRGAQAASAGAVITFAAHVAAMAPCTNIGAATPVWLEGCEVGAMIVNNAAAYVETIAQEDRKSTRLNSSHV